MRGERWGANVRLFHNVEFVNTVGLGGWDWPASTRGWPKRNLPLLLGRFNSGLHSVSAEMRRLSRA